MRQTCIKLVVVWMMFMGLVSCEQGARVETEKVDSLNLAAYEQKFASLSQARQLVDEAYQMAQQVGYKDGMAEALLNRGDVYGMEMDYDSAQVCYRKVLAESNNDLICSVADVDMMSVCLMTAMNKEFYDYRSDAQERFSNVKEATDDMTDHQRVMWNAVQTEYHFVSLNYFIKMRQDEGMNEEFEWLEANQDLFVADTTQWCSYLFLKSLYTVQENGSADVADDIHRSLMRLYAISRQKGYTYYEASALNGLARSLVSGNELRPSRRSFLEEVMGEPCGDDMALLFANRAIEVARQYGNAFVQTTALVTLSNYYLKNGEDSLALAQMEQALALINENHQQVCCIRQRSRRHAPDMLRLYAQTEDTLSTEMRWIIDPNVVAVPDWMAMVREQLSIVYGAMGKKAESDYNHNIFFDILDATRQDLRVQQEGEHLMQEERTLNWLLWGGIMANILLVWLLYVYNKRSRKKYHEKLFMLSRVIEICKHLSAAIPEDVEDEETLDAALHQVTDEEVEKLFPQTKGQKWTDVDMQTMKGLDLELFHVLRVFYDWMRLKGLQYIRFAEQKTQLEGETYVLGKRLEENKRQYIEKLTSMSIVNGITPFLDRALHEVQKLKEGNRISSEQLRERFLYLSELIDKINEYNNILGHWVKIRQGLVTLNIENFALEPLFDTLRHGTKTFDMKGISLAVNETECVVKADKALTLFMMNTLLDNARKYTPQGGEVRLSAEESENYVEVSVEDTGHGMSAEDVDTLNNSKVYDSSKIGAEGVNASDISRNKGFGFGLMNCKGIIEKYKKTNAVFNVCQFGVESEMGKGSRFFFRLPKGVQKAMVICGMLLMGICTAQSATKEGTSDADNLYYAASYADSIYAANVSGQYEKAVLYADSAIDRLNRYCHTLYPKDSAKMELEGPQMAELKWWEQGYQLDYDLIIGIRNEVAIAALSLNRNALYHYNTEVFTRLYKLMSTDPTLEDFCNDIRTANQNKKTTVILLGMLLFLVIAVYLFLYYRNNQLFIFNLRQFIQLNNQVFTASEEALPEVLHQGLSDIKMTDTVGMMLPSHEQPEHPLFTFTGNQSERSMYESMMLSAYSQRKEMTSGNGHFHAYPLVVSETEGEQPMGVLGIRFHDGNLTDEESLIVNLVVRFMSIHTYFSYYKVGEMNELLEMKEDERMRIANEQQKVHVRNQIMDNSLSTLKHETMYYPNRIKQIVDAALNHPESMADATVIQDIDELLSYYKAIFTILSACAGKQVEMVLFKRTLLSAETIGEMAVRSFKKQGKKAPVKTSIRVAPTSGLQVQGDKIFLQTLIDNIISLYFEHHSGGDLHLDFEVSDGFAKFAFTDTAYRYPEEELSQLFYVDNIRYDAQTDTLSGAQYMICRQIIREHDAYSSRRGCRIYVENEEESQGSRFVFTLPTA